MRVPVTLSRERLQSICPGIGYEVFLDPTVLVITQRRKIVARVPGSRPALHTPNERENPTCTLSTVRDIASGGRDPDGLGKDGAGGALGAQLKW